MNTKKTTVITISATLALILLVATATFAYFQADLGNNKEVDVSVSTLTENDRFSFAVGAPLALQADETSFVKGGDSVSDTTTATALLTANNKTNNATKYYYLYLLISQNEFLYSQNENTPELILTITKPDGTELTTLDGLTYKTITDGKGTTIKGFDITTKKGLITIADNRKITTTSTIEEKWSITLTLVNYDVNQIDNLGKMFSSKLIIQQDKARYDMACDESELACHVIRLYTGTQGDNGIYYHNSSLTNGAGDNSYRYAGASNNVNNYICLGSDSATCPDANLFRIIGVFGDKTKVIRAKSVGDQKWHTSQVNTWSSSSLNTYLNGTYLTSLGTLADKIATTTWKVGGGSSTYLYDVPTTAYQYEVGSSASATTYDAKIGLMYLSDYGFAADQSGWTTKLSSYNSNTSKNWLYLGSTEWTLSRRSDTTYYAFSVYSTGNVGYDIVTYSNGVRPSFNLESSVKYVSGSGSMSDPVRVN